MSEVKHPQDAKDQGQATCYNQINMPAEIPARQTWTRDCGMEFVFSAMSAAPRVCRKGQSPLRQGSHYLNGGMDAAPSNGGLVEAFFGWDYHLLPMILNGYAESALVRPQGTHTWPDGLPSEYNDARGRIQLHAFERRGSL